MLKKAFSLRQSLYKYPVRLIQHKQNVEDIDFLFQNLESKLKDINLNPSSDSSLDRTQPYVYQQKGSVIFLRGGSWKFSQILNITDSQQAMVIALQEKHTVAMLLNRGQDISGMNITAEGDQCNIKLSYGRVQNLNSQEGNIQVNQLKLRKAPLKRNLIQEQLYTGHLRLDMADPLSKGNFIVMKGDKRASGKNIVVQGAINNFLKEDKQNKVVYVGNSKEYFSKVDNKDQIMYISPDESDDSQQFLAPIVGLKFTQDYVDQQKNKAKILFVFDDLIQHQLKEKFIFDQANQPFSPVNIMNELMENTGIFEKYEMTTLVLLHTDSTSMMTQIDEINVQKNLNSIADQILDFNAENCKLTKGLMPQMGLNFTPRVMDSWQKPYLRCHITAPFRNLMQKIEESQKSHFAKKEFKIAEDPWENYLFYDAKRLIPIICHSQSLSIEQQVILVKFILQTVQNETISQYKIAPKTLMEELLQFAESFEKEGQDDQEDDIIDDEEEEVATVGDNLMKRVSKVLEDNKDADVLEKDIERMLKMFYLQMRVKGLLNEFRDDYFV